MTARPYADSLYPDWTGPRTELPSWVKAFGLARYRPLIQRVYASAPHWQQAEADGIPNIAPVLVKFCATPSQIKREIGSEAWKAVHHASLKANIDRLVLCLLGGWSFDEALEFPPKERLRAKGLLKHSKPAVILASRCAIKGGDFRSFLTMADDVIRMGGYPDPSWGRNRLKREHDAMIIRSMLARADHTPWSKGWWFDTDGYSFSLLKSEAELAIEGALQRHCVRSYAHGCRTGEEVVLRIEGAERGTCSWRRDESYIQIKGFANSSLSRACHRAATEARAAYQRCAGRESGE